MPSSRRVVVDLPTSSHNLGHPVQEQLSKAQTSCDSTLDGRICTSDSEDIRAGGQKSDLTTVVEDMRDVLTWNKFIEEVETCPSNLDFLFRAHRHIGTSPPTFVPDLVVSFDCQFRRIFYVDQFAWLLARHLSKTQEEKEIGGKIGTCFVSMSPILEWTVHTAGQKANDVGQNTGEEVGLAIFDVKKLRQHPDTTIFRVSDILSFLKRQDKDDLIAQDLQKWAQNCNEYVSMGKIPDVGLVRWIPWDEISNPSPTFFPSCFVKAYTLRKYREWKEEREIGLEILCQRIVKFGKILAGQQDDLLFPLIKLVLKPGIHFWAFKTEASEDIEAKIHEILEEMALEKLSELSI